MVLQLVSIRRNLVFNFLLSCSNVLLPLLSIPYVSRVLDPDGIGRVGFMDSFSFYFVIIAEFGVTTYGIREVARCQGNRLKLEKLVPELLVLHIITSLATAVLYFFSIYLLWDKIGDARLLWFSMGYFAMHFLACEWYFMGTEQFGYIALRSVLIRVLGLVSILLMVQGPADYFLYYAAIAGSSILTNLLNFVILCRRLRLRFSGVNWRTHTRFVWVTYLISLFYSIPLMLDNVLLGLVGTAGMVGLYSLSARVVRVGTTLLTDSFLVFFPRVVSLSTSNDTVQLEQKLSFSVRFILLFSIPMSMGILLLSDELALVFFGDKLADAAYLLRILCLFPLIKGLSLFLSNPVLIARQKEKALLNNLVVSGMLFLVACPLLSSAAGSAGACVALMLAELLLLFLNIFTVRRLIPGFRTGPQPLLIIIAGSLLFVPVRLACNFFLEQGPLRLAITVAACMGCYGLLLILSREGFTRLVLEGIRKKTGRTFHGEK